MVVGRNTYFDSGIVGQLCPSALSTSHAPSAPSMLRTTSLPAPCRLNAGSVQIFEIRAVRSIRDRARTP
ncbi:hypothetical protein EC988_008758, partial [Linderina pennispora]